MKLTSITSDGDAAIHRIVACEYDSSEVVTYRDPNHYAKSLEKDFGGLSAEFKVLKGLGAKLKAHFLVGTTHSSRHILKAKSITNYFLYQESLVLEMKNGFVIICDSLLSI